MSTTVISLFSRMFFQKILSLSVWLVFNKDSLYSRAVCNQERVMMARVRYLNFIFIFRLWTTKEWWGNESSSILFQLHSFLLCSRYRNSLNPKLSMLRKAFLRTPMSMKITLHQCTVVYFFLLLLKYKVSVLNGWIQFWQYKSLIEVRPHLILTIGHFKHRQY